MKPIFFVFLLSSLLLFPLKASAQGFFLSFEGTLGRHNVEFKEFASTPALSFGFKVSAGFTVVESGSYSGGPQYTLIEGASFHPNRRKLSEDFELKNPDFDKHIVYNFAMFRSSNVGWTSFIDVGGSTFYHSVGFGIFGLTENDPLFNFGIHNNAGILLGNSATQWKIGLSHDLTIGNGNPNYSISNLALNLGLGLSPTTSR